MTRLMLAAALALVAASGAALAQTATTPPAPLIVAPPVGTLSTTDTMRKTSADGTTTEKTETTYRNTDGVARQSETRTDTPAQVPVPQTSSSYETTTSTTVTPVPWERSCPPHNHYDAKTDSCIYN
jgi:hypothetical protein